MKKLTWFQEKEIEETHEYQVLTSNDEKVMGKPLMDGLYRLIARKTNIPLVQVKTFVEDRMTEKKGDD